MKKRIQRLIARHRKVSQLLFVVIFAGLGTATILLANAATPTVSVEICDNTPVQGNAFIGHDHPNTSCGHYVSFGFDPPTTVGTSLTKVAGGVIGAVDMVATKAANDNRLFIVTQGGKIHISNKDGANASAVFLDLSSKVTYGGERGLLGLAFDPNYAQNGYFYVNYVANASRGTFNGRVIGAGDTVISRFTRSSSNPNVADPSSELIIMGYDQPGDAHKGGGLQFGPDGFLYISSGDGAGGPDNVDVSCSAKENGQCLGTYLGKILRIDVAGATASQRYKVPSSNPFVGTAGAKPEIWHYGLRNPWRFSFDRQTGDMFIGDVGQSAWEEINFVAAGVGGKNFGWSCYEGAHGYNNAPGGCPSSSQVVNPIFEYNHNMGCSVTGGFVYRGTQNPAANGTYVFSDYCTSKLWHLTKGSGGAWSITQTINTGFPGSSVSALGQDQVGELYVAILSGNVYRIDFSH